MRSEGAGSDYKTGQDNPLLRVPGDDESYLHMVSVRTPLIEGESDRESCV